VTQITVILKASPHYHVLTYCREDTTMLRSDFVKFLQLLFRF